MLLGMLAFIKIMAPFGTLRAPLNLNTYTYFLQECPSNEIHFQISNMPKIGGSASNNP